MSVLLLLFAVPVEAQRPGTFDPALAVEVRFAEDALPQARGQLMSSAIRGDIAKVERLIPIQDSRYLHLRRTFQWKKQWNRQRSIMYQPRFSRISRAIWRKLIMAQMA
ncbi:MAG: hypothetical protein LC662_06475 [Rhodothermaceae bacterium]|nr:hypothetical protein [Rhodothermaceae bacterium]